MHGNDTAMFLRYIESPRKVIYPWSLDIVDCYFLVNAFKVSSESTSPVRLIRKFSVSDKEEVVTLGSAYDLYKIDTEAYGSEVILIDEKFECFCYWDIHERFVGAVGTEEFLSIARPYPVDIQKHRYIETMSDSESIKDEGGADVVYHELISM